MVFFDVAFRCREGRPAIVPFARTKYAPPLLVDAGYVSAYTRFDQDGRPHQLDFFDILLVTQGRGVLLIDDERHVVSPGMVLFTRPGQIRQWRSAELDGACMFFREEFVNEAFSDPRFLEQFAVFRADRPCGVLRLSARQRADYLRVFGAMTRELAAVRPDAGHALRAVLYELLVLLHRAYIARHDEADAADSDVVGRFRARLERDFKRMHRVADYAAAIGVSPGHLNTVCRSALRKSAGACIRERLVLEARRLLLYSDQTAAEVAYSLGFDDPSYFARFFRREGGMAPIRFRREHRVRA